MKREPVAQFVIWSGAFCLTILVAMFVVGLAATWSGVTAFVATLFFGLALCVSIIASALFLLAYGIVLTFRVRGIGKKAFTACVAPTLLFVTTMAALPALLVGRLSGIHFMLMMERSHYDAIVVGLQAGGRAAEAGIQEAGSIEFLVDRGPPLRVAFNPQGMLGNWSGIVFDPTGDVMQADGLDRTTGIFAAPSAVPGLFGGDLVRCIHLDASYYYCSFTLCLRDMTKRRRAPKSLPCHRSLN